jgi:hypothetical protein
MRPREFLIVFFVVGLVVPIAVLHFLQPLSGDLTRLGLLPEQAFGWNTPQPTIGGRSATVEKLEDAEILVIGDSFSISGVWQAYAFPPERKYITLRLGRICRDYPGYIASLGKPPKTLIIEVVERNARDVLTVDCAESLLKTVDGKQELRSGGPRVLAHRNGDDPQPSDRQKNIIDGTFGYKYVLGSALYYLFPGVQHRPGSDGGVWIKKVDDGCRLFSHAECEFSLFLGHDFTRPRLGENFKSSKLAIVKTSAERVLVIVVPDKSSVYLESRDQALRKDEALRALGRELAIEIVPLHATFNDAKFRIKDLYSPNNTHLSTAGYRELATQLAAHDSSWGPARLP